MKIVGYIENPDGTVAEVKLDNGNTYPMPTQISISQEEAGKLPIRIQAGVLFLGGTVVIEPDVPEPVKVDPVSVFEGTIIDQNP